MSIYKVIERALLSADADAQAADMTGKAARTNKYTGERALRASAVKAGKAVRKAEKTNARESSMDSFVTRRNKATNK